MSYQSTQQIDHEWGEYKFWDMYGLHAAYKFVQRNPYAQFCTYGIRNEALLAGFDLFEKEGNEPLPTNAKAQKVLQPMFRALSRGAGHEALYGANSFVLLTKTDKYKFKLPMLYPIAPLASGYKIEFNPDTSLKKFEFNFSCHQSIVGHEPIVYEGDQLDNVFPVVHRPYYDMLWHGHSYIEPIWDNLIALSAISSNSTYYVIRVGAGLKIMYLDEHMFNDEDTKNKIENFLKKLNSVFSYTMIPTSPATEAGRTELDINTGGGQINFDEIKQINVEAISAYMNVPTIRFTGAIPGQLMGAEVSRSLYFGTLQDFQNLETPTAEWLVNRLHEQNYIQIKDDYEISWKVKKELNEVERVAVQQQKFIIAFDLMDRADKSYEEAIKIAGLEI